MSDHSEFVKFPVKDGLAIVRRVDVRRIMDWPTEDGSPCSMACIRAQIGQVFSEVDVFVELSAEDALALVEFDGALRRAIRRAK